MTLPSDPDLVRRCLEGEENAWEILTTRYADLVYGVARRSGVGAADAGDVVQEVFLALLQNLKKLRNAERLLPWILKTARRQSWRTVKKARGVVARERAGARGEIVEGPLPEEELVSLEREQTVRMAFAELGERCRRLLDALFFRGEGPRYAEVAEELGVPVGSIGPTRRRCLERLERALTARGLGTPGTGVSGAPRPASRGVRSTRS